MFRKKKRFWLWAALAGIAAGIASIFLIKKKQPEIKEWIEMRAPRVKVVKKKKGLKITVKKPRKRKKRKVKKKRRKKRR